MYKLTNTTTIIRLSDSAHIPDDPANSDRQQYEAWLAEGNTPEPVDPPTDAQIEAEYRSALNSHYNSVANEKQYDSYITCALRAGYAGPYQAEGAAFGIWMDEQNVYAFAQIEAIIAGTRTAPTKEEFISELSPMVWPV